METKDICKKFAAVFIIAVFSFSQFLPSGFSAPEPVQNLNQSSQPGVKVGDVAMVPEGKGANNNPHEAFMSDSPLSAANSATGIEITDQFGQKSTVEQIDPVMLGKEIALKMGVDPKRISNLRYVMNKDAVFCQGTGCPTWEAYLDFDVQGLGHYVGLASDRPQWRIANDAQKHVSTKIIEIDYLLETDLEVEAVAALGKHLKVDMRSIESLKVFANPVCFGTGCPVWSKEFKMVVQKGYIQVFSGTITKRLGVEAPYQITVKDMSKVQIVAPNIMVITDGQGRRTKVEQIGSSTQKITDPNGNIFYRQEIDARTTKLITADGQEIRQIAIHEDVVPELLKLSTKGLVKVDVYGDRAARGVIFVKHLNANVFQVIDPSGKTSTIQRINPSTIVVTEQGRRTILEQVGLDTQRITDFRGNVTYHEKLDSEVTKIVDSNGGVSLVSIISVGSPSVSENIATNLMNSLISKAGLPKVSISGDYRSRTVRLDMDYPSYRVIMVLKNGRIISKQHLPKVAPRPASVRVIKK